MNSLEYPERKSNAVGMVAYSALPVPPPLQSSGAAASDHPSLSSHWLVARTFQVRPPRGGLPGAGGPGLGNPGPWGTLWGGPRTGNVNPWDISTTTAFPYKCPVGISGCSCGYCLLMKRCLLSVGTACRSIGQAL